MSCLFQDPVISVSCLLEDSLSFVPSPHKAVANKTRAGTKPCQKLSHWAKNRFWIESASVMEQQAAVFLGWLPWCAQQQSIPLRQCGCRPVSTKSVAKFPSASRRWGFLFNPLGSVWAFFCVARCANALLFPRFLWIAWCDNYQSLSNFLLLFSFFFF